MVIIYFHCYVKCVIVHRKNNKFCTFFAVCASVGEGEGASNET